MFKKDKDNPLKSLKLGIYKPINIGDSFLVKEDFSIDFSAKQNYSNYNYFKKINLFKDNNILTIIDNLSLPQLYLIEIQRLRSYNHIMTRNISLPYNFFEEHANLFERV